ncbi:MAG: YqgE/AlgH family protein [Wenzhouxiangellaceae bacterium]
MNAPSTADVPNYLDHQLLIAMPGMDDPNFNRGVTLMCQHNADGALGITINRPSNFSVLDVLSQLGIDCKNSQLGIQPVLEGGPVHRERGFVLHEPGQEWESSVALSDRLQLTTSRDILQAIGRGEGPTRFLLALGYAGWAAGQLEEELRDNAWLLAPSDEDIVFDLPYEQRWETAFNRIGINLSNLHSTGGHA